MNIEQLQKDHAIPGQLSFATGKGGFPVIQIDNGIRSDRAYYQDGKAIKGGVPVCWPWFGPDPEGLGRPAHGFVRNRSWAVSGTESTADGDTRVILKLKDSTETREIWPRTFELTLAITVADTLTLELLTSNRGGQPFTITQALHSYFRIGDIGQVKVHGLEDRSYLDKVDGGAEKRQAGPVTVSGEVDRIYTDVAGDLVIDDKQLGRRIRIQSAGSRTAVVWNPWNEIAANAGDLEDDDYQRMICVETANAAEDTVKVQSGETYRLRANYRVERD
jgi:glucose-6-phosphate 1-epimerase